MRGFAVTVSKTDDSGFYKMQIIFVFMFVSLLFSKSGGTLEKIIYVAIGGSLGALSRYGISLLCVELFGERFPYGTLIVNLAGCFLIGLAFSLGVERNIISPSFRLFFITGFLGALTTFSAYGIESINFARDGLLNTSLINIAANNFGGFILILVGLWIGRII